MERNETRLRAGTAAAEITPQRMLDLQGYSRGPATGTLDPLEARAIVFDDGATRVAIVTADLVGLDLPSVARIRAAAAFAAGMPAEHVMVCCSHTHSGPAVQVLAESAVEAEYQAWVETALADLAAAAARELQPVRLGVGEGAMDFNVNRRRRTPQGTTMRANPLGPVDRRVRVLRVDRAERAFESPGTLGGQPLPQADPLALLFSYTCHATVLGGQNFRYSGDYPAAARRVVERAYGADGTAAGQRGGQTSALFLPGCFGNVRPHLLREDGGFRGATDHELTVLGRLLGSEVVQVAERVVAEPVEQIAVARREVPVRYTAVPTEAELRAALEGRSRGWARTLLDRLAREGRLPDQETAEVQVLRLGRHWIAGTSGETMLEIGLSIEHGLVELGLADPLRGDLTLSLGYTNGNVGYLCTAASLPEGGYEPAAAYLGYRRPGPFGPETEATLVATALSLAQEIASPRVA